jgi:hypothetical protein
MTTRTFFILVIFVTFALVEAGKSPKITDRVGNITFVCNRTRNNVSKGIFGYSSR